MHYHTTATITTTEITEAGYSVKPSSDCLINLGSYGAHFMNLFACLEIFTHQGCRTQR